MSKWRINVWSSIGTIVYVVESDREMTEDWAHKWCYWWRNKFPDNYYLELIREE